ncbi:hypothetical protein DSECCO2_505940 [anaerobic digester metagenome]
MDAAGAKFEHVLPLLVDFHIAALTQSGAGRRIDGGRERMDKKEAIPLERAGIIAEQGENQRFLRPQDF